MKTVTARVLPAVLVLFVAGCNGYSDTTRNAPSTPAQPAPQSKTEKGAKPAYSCPKTQDLVERTAAAHPEAEAVAVHAQPKGFDHSFRIASSKRELVGEADEEDDLDAMRGNRTVVVAPGDDDEKGKKGGKKDADDDEGAFWDVTMPLHTGGATAPVGVLEVLLKADAAKTKAEAQAKAETVRAEVEKGLAVTDQTWP